MSHRRGATGGRVEGKNMVKKKLKKEGGKGKGKEKEGKEKEEKEREHVRSHGSPNVVMGVTKIALHVRM